MQHVINLTENESGFLEYKAFKLQAIQNIIDAFIINNNEIDYKEDHLEKVIDKYSEIFTDIRKYILELAKKNGMKNIQIDNYTYYFDRTILVLNN